MVGFCSPESGFNRYMPQEQGLLAGGKSSTDLTNSCHNLAFSHTENEAETGSHLISVKAHIKIGKLLYIGFEDITE